ncbi:ABC transporter permease [Phascolarctobacterium faecium]|uniref:ABC transporter permease n=1 Tax=Phascolarctobacterium faecium TaxID=33025 RepID=UPI00266F2327|nr:ABC transporter permease [Phascolarctobacterium faecium]
MKKSNLQFYCAASVLLLIIGASILAPLLVTHNPFEPDMANRLQSPSWQHFFGTDALGRDMFSRILYGGRASILLSLASAILSLGVGLVIGLFCGFYGGKLDMLCTIASNIFQGIPGSCFMIAIAGIFGPSIKSLVLALVITSWAGFSRIVRAEVMQLKEEPFIEGLRCLGCSDSRLLLHHIIPNIVNKLLILFTIRVGRGILSIAGLSFLGLGVQPPTPDWSVMVSDAVLYYRSSPHLILIPGACIFFLIYAINNLGEFMRDKLDVRFNEVRKW